MSNEKNGDDEKMSSSWIAGGVTASQAGSANSDSLIGNLVPRPAASLQMDEKLFLHKEEAERLRRRIHHTSTSSDDRHEMIDAFSQRNTAKRRKVSKVASKPPPMNLKPPPSGGLPPRESQDSKPAARPTTESKPPSRPTATGESSDSSEDSADPSHEEDNPPRVPTPLRPDSDAPLIRAEGQLARHPEMTDAEAILAAKREYNRRNAARARKRNRTLVTDLQQNVYKLAADIANLKADNSKLRAKLQTLTDDNAALVQAQQTIAPGHRASAAAPVSSTGTVQAQDLLQLVESGGIHNEQLNQPAESHLDSVSRRPSAAASAAQTGASPNSFASSPPFNPLGTPLPPTNSQVEGMHQVLQMINARSLQRENLVQDLERQQQQRQSNEARHQMMQLVDQIQLQQQQQQQQHYQNQVLQILHSLLPTRLKQQALQKIRTPQVHTQGNESFASSSLCAVHEFSSQPSRSASWV